MALTTVTASGGDRKWSTAATWNNGVPGAGDQALTDINSGSFSLDSSVSVASFVMTAFTGTFTMDSGTAIDASGVVTLVKDVVGDGTNDILCGGALDCSGLTSISSGITLTMDFGGAGTEAFTPHASLELPNLVFSGGGDTTFSVVTNAIIAESVNISTSTLDGDSLGATISGDCKRNSGKWINSGTITLSGDGTAQDIANNAFSFQWTVLDVPTGTEANLTDTTFVRALTGAGIISTATAKTLRFVSTADGWWTFTGTIDVEIRLFPTNGSTPDGDITLDNSTFIVVGSNTTLTMGSNAMNTGTGLFWVFGFGDGQFGEALLNDLTCGELKLGDSAGSNRYGKVDFGSGVISIASLTEPSSLTKSELSLVSSSITVSAEMNGDNITITNTGATVSGAGSLTNVEVTGTELNATPMGPAGDEGGNVNVRFIDSGASVVRRRGIGTLA